MGFENTLDASTATGKPLLVERLPIDAHLSSIVAALREHSAVVISAAPGAGKTTRVPSALLDAGLAGSGRVVVLQPRRVAARAAARRVAEERRSAPGAEVGWQIRFENRSSAATRILFITEGILTRWLMENPELPGVGCVVLDEFHERSLHADVGLALLREVQQSLRPDLRLVVMSATLDAAPVAAFLGGAPLIEVPGRMFPLEIRHAEARDDRPLPSRAAAATRVALRSCEGDVLVFLPGVGEIRRTFEALSDLNGVDILPLHGELRSEEQDRVLSVSARRKVILATNIAETSLTIPGVRAVVDSGEARFNIHDPDHGIDRLELRSISRASATQRAGRAGRTAPGVVYRLWTKAEEAAMPEFETPELQRVDLARTALELHAFGERDLAKFAWFEAPAPEALVRAESLLQRLGAVRDGVPTATGRRMLDVAAHPRVARLLLATQDAGVLAQGVWLAALLSERDIVRRTDAASLVHLPTGPSDVLARRDMLAGGDGRSCDRAAVDVVQRAAEQYAAALSVRAAPMRAAVLDAEESTLLRCLLQAWPDRVARRLTLGGADGMMVGGRGVTLGPASVVRDAELFLVLDADLGRRGLHARAQVRVASAVEPAWLSDIPGALQAEESVVWDDTRGRAMRRKVQRYEDLVLSESQSPVQDAAAGAAALRAMLQNAPEALLEQRAEELQLLLRLSCLRAWRPELELPVLDAAALVAAVDPWIEQCPSLEDVRRVPLHDLLTAIMGERRLRDALTQVPESLSLPSGSTRVLEYAADKPPVLAVRLQELFGEPDTPTIAGGRVRVLLHLLAPNHQVVQVTHDLKSFWNTTYQQVRKDLRGRYPRHSWPEDPWTAEPTARAKRRKP